MNKIIFILIAIIIVGCGIQRPTYCERKEKKVARILKDCPNIITSSVEVDTVYITDTFNILVNTPIDSNAIDSLLLEYCKAGPDSIRTVTIRKYIYKECEKINDGNFIVKDNNGQTVMVNIKGREISVITNRAEIKKEVTVVTPSIQQSNLSLFKTWYGLFLLLLVVGFILGVLARK